MSLLSFSCNKEDTKGNNNQSDTSISEYSFAPNGDTNRRWIATKIEDVEHLSGSTLIVLSNNGSTVYNEILKETYPNLTERFYIFLFSNNLAVGKYILKYGTGTQGSAELAIKQSSDLSAPNADSLYKISEVGAESYFQINKIENNKISGEFYFHMFQPLTGATSLKILECKSGLFKNIDIR